MIRIVIDRDRPSADAIARAADAIRRGGIVVFPTDTLYGIAADPHHGEAVGRVFAAKGRPDDKPLPLVAASLGDVEALTGHLSGRLRRLALAYWPGPLTILFPAPTGLVAAIAAGTGRVGVRVPDHAVARALCAAAGTPLTATSANRSGEAPTSDPRAVSAEVLAASDVFLDAGPTAGGPASTVVDVAGGRPSLVRAGPISMEQIEACWNQT